MFLGKYLIICSLVLSSFQSFSFERKKGENSNDLVMASYMQLDKLMLRISSRGKDEYYTNNNSSRIDLIHRHGQKLNFQFTTPTAIIPYQEDVGSLWFVLLPEDKKGVKSIKVTNSLGEILAEKIADLSDSLIDHGDKPGLIDHGDKPGLIDHGDKPGLIDHGDKPGHINHQGQDRKLPFQRLKQLSYISTQIGICTCSL